MTLIKSISGIRGTIGGKVNDGLTPLDAVTFAAAYGTWLIQTNQNLEKLKPGQLDKLNIEIKKSTLKRNLKKGIF